MVNIYLGRNSCYCRYEGICIEGHGVNYKTGRAIAELIIRDMMRGWSYDHSCNKIKFTPEHAIARLRYLYALCCAHYGKESDECKKLKKYLWDLIKEIKEEIEFRRRIKKLGLAKAIA